MQTAPSHIQLRLDNCLWCGKPLPSGRYDRKTHNDCRLKLHRWKSKMKVARKTAVDRIHTIEGFMNYEWLFCEAVEELKQIQDALNDAYRVHNIVRVK